ncbi:hypothetical protein GGF32_003917 [Allomyces javanicus]|nr:hypothetical protein GGF32_003917 [Allomyces javanicus]
MSNEPPLAEPAGTPQSDVRLPSFLYDHYLQYKNDTSKLTTRLVTTAATLGYRFGSKSAPAAVISKSASAKPKQATLQRKGGKLRKVDNRHRQQNAAVSSNKSPSGQRAIKVCSYTTLMFRDRLFPNVGAVSPLERSSSFVTRISNLVDDLIATGKMAPTRLGTADAKFAGRSLQPLLDVLQQTGWTGLIRQRTEQQPNSEMLLWFVRALAVSEFDLLRCDLLSLHLKSVEALSKVFLKNMPLMLQLAGQATVIAMVKDMALVIGWIFVDWLQYCNLRQHGQPVQVPEAMHCATEFLQSWTQEPFAPGHPTTNGNIGVFAVASRRLLS